MLMQLRQVRGWLVRLFGLFHRNRRDREFAKELESHLAMHIEDNLRAGMSPEEARRVALVKLGGVTQVQELHREQRGLPMLETLFQDLRFGARMLFKNPGFTLIAVATLALGIGANTAIFSVCNAVLFKPLPYAEPSRIVTLSERMPDGKPSDVASANFVDWRNASHSFTEMAAFRTSSFAPYFILGTQTEASRLTGEDVSANF